VISTRLSLSALSAFQSNFPAHTHSIKRKGFSSSIVEAMQIAEQANQSDGQCKVKKTRLSARNGGRIQISEDCRGRFSTWEENWNSNRSSWVTAARFVLNAKTAVPVCALDTRELGGHEGHARALDPNLSRRKRPQIASLRPLARLLGGRQLRSDEASAWRC
jgi:hypothetical protein